MQTLVRRRYIILLSSLVVLFLCFPAVISLIRKADLPVIVYTADDSVLVKSLKTEIPHIMVHDKILSLDGISISSREDIEVIMDFKNIGDKIEIIYLSGGLSNKAEVIAIPFYSREFIIFQSLTAFLFMLFGCFVFIRCRENKPAELFYLAMTGAAIIMIMTWGKINNSINIDYIVRILFHASYILTPLFFLHFSLSFPSDRTQKYRNLLRLLYVTAAVLVMINVYSFLIMAGSPGAETIRFYINVFNGGRAFLSICVIASLLVFFIAYFRTKDAVQQKKLKWLIFGFLVGPLSFIVLWVVPQALTDYGIIAEEYLSLLMLSVPITFSISILKYHLLDIDIILNRSIIYSFVAAGIIIVYIITVLVISGLIADTNQIYISTLSAVLVAFLFNPIKNYIKKFVDKKFFRVQYDFREAVKNIFSEIKEINDINTLSEKVVSGIQILIPAEKIAMIDLEDRKSSKMLYGMDFSETDVQFLNDNIFRNHSLLFNIAVPEKIEGNLSGFEKEESLKSADISLIITSAPVNNKIYSVVVLGNKKSGQRYLPEDIDLIQSVVNTAASAIARLKLQEDLIRKNIETEKLMELNRQKSLFVSSVSHDLKTPLTSIRMYSELIKMADDSGSDKINSYAGYIEGESDRLTRLIDNVLNFSRIEKGIKEYYKKQTNLDALLRHSINLLDYDLKLLEFKIDKDIPEQEMPVLADPDALIQVFINLINNAVKYSGSSKIITISCCKIENFYCVKIMDNGIGISEDDKKQLFQPFFRSEQVQKMKISGTGLGLSIIKHIADAHEIDIKINSTLYKGTTFELLIPIYNAERKYEEHFIN
jgi:signal transduction histidine kinase